MSVAYYLEAQQNPSRGVRGGLASPPTEVWMLNAAGERVEVPPVAALELQPGERIVSVSAGGGGYGDPLTRDPAAVLHDVLEGWVSRERAREVYGVVLSESGEAVDVAATEARRAPPR
jgi:N-methylhydantoinase B